MAPRVPTAARPDLTVARHRFLLALDDRLDSLRQVIELVASDPRSEPGRNQLTRRLRAMGDACTALGFEEMSAAFASAETAFDCSSDADSTRRALSEIRDTLDLVPSLAPVISAPVPPPSAPVRQVAASPVPSAPAPQPAAQSQSAPSTPIPSADPVSAPIQRKEPRSSDAITVPEPAVLKTRPLAAPRRVIVLGTMRLMDTVLRADERSDTLRFEFTVDLTDASDLASATGHAACLVDVRHRDAEAAWQRLSEFGLCVLLLPSGASTPTWASRAKTLAADTELAPQLLQLLDGPPANAGPAPSAQAPVLAAADTSFIQPPPPKRSVEAPVPAPPRAPTPTQPSASRTGSGKRNGQAEVTNLAHRTVLIADGDAGMAWFLVGVLRAAGAIVLEARDGLEAWRLARERAPDLVVSDVELPELDGFGLCRQLKRDVILSDVPVLLVSWKEDSLQRARELGAGAEGYFLKESDSSTILRRCAEALQPRRNVEHRLADGKEVQGRLTGMTPHSVLRSTCDVVDNARITFEDAGYRIVVHVGDGRLLDARRESDTGASITGSAVLPSLLGMRAGRFVVERTGADIQSTFTSGLSRLLEPHVARTRRALRIVSGDALHRIARLDLDLDALAPYRGSSPPIVRKLIDKLADAVAPVALIRSVSPGLLETALADIALRGAILSAWDMDGNDLLQASDLFNQPFDLDIRTPTSGFEVVSAPGAPRIDGNSTAEQVEQAAAFTRSLTAGPTVAPSPQAPLVQASPAPCEVDVQPEPPASDAPAELQQPARSVLASPPPKPRPSRVPRPEAFTDSIDSAPLAALELDAFERALDVSDASPPTPGDESTSAESAVASEPSPDVELEATDLPAPLPPHARPRIVDPKDDADALDARWLMSDPDAESPDQVLLSVHDNGDSSPVVRILEQHQRPEELAHCDEADALVPASAQPAHAEPSPDPIQAALGPATPEPQSLPVEERPDAAPLADHEDAVSDGRQSIPSPLDERSPVADTGDAAPLEAALAAPSPVADAVGPTTSDLRAGALLADDAATEVSEPSPAPVSDPALEMSGMLFEQLAATPSTPAKPKPEGIRAEPSTRSDELSAPLAKDTLLLSGSVSAASTNGLDEFVEEDDPLFASLHGAPSPSAPRTGSRSKAPHAEDQTNDVSRAGADRDSSTTPPKARDKDAGSRALRDGADRWATAALLAARRAVKWAKERKAETDAELAESKKTEQAKPRKGTEAVTPGEEAKTEATGTQRSPEPDARNSPPTAERHEAEAAPEPDAPQPAKKKLPRYFESAKRAALPTIALLGTAALAFSGVDAITARFAATRDGDPLAAATTAQPDSVTSPASVTEDLMPTDYQSDTDDKDDLSLAPPSTKLASPRLEMHTVELPLPDGVQVPTGKGLLEINTAGEHKIYIDGTFIGKGPIRRVPLGAGAHEVLMRQDGDEDRVQVDVSAGKRVRLEPLQQASAAK